MRNYQKGERVRLRHDADVPKELESLRGQAGVVRSRDSSTNEKDDMATVLFDNGSTWGLYDAWLEQA